MSYTNEIQAAIATTVELLDSMLPKTFYADLPFEQRLAFMVQGWQKSVSACNELEKRIEELEKQLLAMREALVDIQDRISTHDPRGVNEANQIIVDTISSTPADLASKYVRREVLEAITRRIEACDEVLYIYDRELILTLARKELENPT